MTAILHDPGSRRIIAMTQPAPGFRIAPLHMRLSIWVTLTLGLCLSPVVSCAQEVVISPIFDDVGHFHEGIAPASISGKWGFIDRKGKWIVEPRFEEVQAGGGGRFGVRVGNVWGFLSSSGQMTIEPAFESVKAFSSGMAAVRINGKWGYINPFGELIDQPEFDFAGEAVNGFRFVKKQEFLVLNDLSGQVFFDLYLGGDIIEVGAFASNGRAPVRNDAGWFLISVSADPMLGPYKACRGFSDGLAAVSQDGRTWGYVDTTGKLAIQAEYQNARGFSHGIAPVKAGGVWGFVDAKGHIVLSPKYDDLYSVREGWAIYRIGEKRGFLKVSSSEEIVEALSARFEDAFSPKDGLAPVKIEGKWGFLHLANTGTVVRDIVDLEAN
jgi:hypothetical protein